MRTDPSKLKVSENACAGLLGVSCLDLNLMIDMSTIKSLGKVSAPKGKDPWTDVWSFHRFEKRHMIDRY